VTYKASALWRTAGGISLRGTYGTAFRAPNIAELYAGKADSFVLVEDPCDTNPGSGPKTLDAATAKECAKEGVPTNANFGSTQLRAQVGGNPQLKAETAKIGTAGIVWEPLAGLGITLDYWNIEIDNQITSVPVSTILSQCYEQGNQNYCNPALQGTGISRASNGQISYVYDPTANIGQLSTSGLDFAIGYTWKLPDVGRFRHALEGTYLFKYNLDTGSLGPDGKEVIIHGKGSYDLGVNPDLKVNLLTSWQHPSGFGAGFNIRYVDSFRECGGNDCADPDPTNSSRQVDSYITADLYLDYVLKSSQGTTSISIGVNNITDATPSTIYNGAALNSDESIYDFMGRFFYARLSQLF
jgi:iron complex outermembrane receptor protein